MILCSKNRDKLLLNFAQYNSSLTTYCPLVSIGFKKSLPAYSEASHIYSFYYSRFDIYRKIPKDLTQPTQVGAISKILLYF